MRSLTLINLEPNNGDKTQDGFDSSEKEERSDWRSVKEIAPSSTGKQVEEGAARCPICARENSLDVKKLVGHLLDPGQGEPCEQAALGPGECGAFETSAWATQCTRYKIIGGHCPICRLPQAPPLRETGGNNPSSGTLCGELEKKAAEVSPRGLVLVPFQNLTVRRAKKP
jgi:hypothetical protein